MTDDFDYENVDPETLKEWKTELLKEFKREMRSYLKQFPDATPEEKRDLRRWVNAGHSPYENGDFIVNDDGGPMDFINAQRFLEVEYQEYLKDPDAYRGTQCSEEHMPLKCDSETGDELPF